MAVMRIRSAATIRQNHPAGKTNARNNNRSVAEIKAGENDPVLLSES